MKRITGYVILTLLIVPLLVVLCVYTLRHASDTDKAVSNNTISSTANQQSSELNQNEPALSFITSEFSSAQINGSDSFTIHTAYLGDVTVLLATHNNQMDMKVNIPYIFTDISAFEGKSDPVAIHMQEYAKEELENKTEDFLDLISKLVKSYCGYDLTYSDQSELVLMFQNKSANKLSLKITDVKKHSFELLFAKNNDVIVMTMTNIK